MGIWSIFTKDLMPIRADLRWKEPWLYRIRLRGDLVARLMLVASGWMAATAVLLTLFSVSENPGGLDIAAGLGAAAGLGPVALYLFFTKHVVSGQVKIIDGVIQRKTQYTGFSGQWAKTVCWDLHVVDPYRLLTAEATGRPFHLLMLELGDDCELIGVPKSLDLPKLVAVLGAGGSAIEHADAVPEQYMRRVSVVGAMVPLAVSAVMLLAAAAAVFW